MDTSMLSTSRQYMATGSSSPPVVEDERGHKLTSTQKVLILNSTKTEVIGLRGRKRNYNIWPNFMQNVSVFLEREP